MFTPEEKKLLQEFQKETKSNPATGLYAFIGIFTGALPIYIFTFILHVDFESNIIIMAIISGLASYALSKSYNNVANQYKPQFEKVLKPAIAASMANDKQSKDDRAVAVKKKTIYTADEQASAFAIFQNNAVFMAIFLFLTFFIFVKVSLTANYIFSVGLAAGLVLLKSS